MNEAIISTDFFGIVTLLVILYGALFESKEKSSRKKVFIILVTTVILSLVTEALGYLHLAWAKNYAMQFYMFLLSHFLPFLVYCVFMQYIYQYMTSKITVSRIPFIIGTCYCIVGVFCTIYYGLQNKILVIENRNLQSGDFFRGYLLTYVVILVYVILIILAYSRRLGLHDSIAAIMFMAIPLYFVILNINFHYLRFSITSLSISMLIINTMLNAEREQTLIANEAVSNQMAHSDELTGLFNRLAFNQQCEQMQGDAMVGVLFADVNALKYTNDHYGHKAGDELLCKVSNILLSCFRKSDVYRISGDEFVVLLKDVPKELFESKIDKMNGKINECEVPIFAWGAVYGVETEIENLLAQAENQMYTQKQMFYAEYPKYRR